MTRFVLALSAALGGAFGQSCDQITLQAQVGIVERHCCARGTTMADGCQLPEECTAKCAHGYEPFFAGDCFGLATADMPAEQREPLVRFGNMCTNTRCPRAELYGRMEEVNAVCARQGHLRRELQILQPNGPRGGAPPTLAPLADHCSADCAEVFTQFYVE